MKFSLCVPDNSPNSNRIQCKFWGNLESGPCTRPSTGICSPSFHLQIHNLRHLTHFQRRPRPPRRSPEIGPENAPLSGKKRRPKPGKHPFGAVLAPSRAQTNYLFVPFSSPGSLFRIRCPGVSRHRACGRRIATPVPRARNSRAARAARRVTRIPVYGGTPLSVQCGNDFPVPPPSFSASMKTPQPFADRKLSPHGLSWPSKRLEISSDEYLYDIADWRISLNTGWRFLWRSNAAVPRDLAHFQAPDFDDSGWKRMTLPATWEMKGFGTPLYVNNGWTFRPTPPVIPAKGRRGCTTAHEPNPTARLRRRFTVPAAWRGRRLRLFVGSAQAAVAVWVNGVYAGLSQDSADAAEFDVTGLCRPGENLLALQVWKYASGTYLEDQDAWRFSGICRDVFLYSLDESYIEDAVYTSNLEERAILAHVRIAHPPPDGRLELRVGGREVAAAWHGQMDPAQVLQLRVASGAFPAWHPERPATVPARLVLRDGTGRIRDIRHARVALRHAEIRNGIFRLNGAPFKFQGVNRHEIDPELGRVMTREAMEKDARAIKAAHFNAVRTAHGTHHPLWYEICDRIGLAVLAEANVESHGLSYLRCVLPGDDPAWAPAVLDRVDRMVRTLRNHPCVVMWSLGNEAGYGNAFVQAAAHVRALDARPIQYADMDAVADADSQTYPTVAWLRAWLEGRAERKGEHGEATSARQHGPQPSGKPYLANEYAHAMGNSTGNFAEYWALIDAAPRLIGGFVWEWREHALRRPGARPGTPPCAYGGDFGDVPNDGNFCCDGLVRGDGTPNPGLAEVRAVQQPLAAAWDPDAPHGTRVRLRNRTFATPLTPREHRLGWRLLCDGLVVADGVGDLPHTIAPQSAWTWEVPDFRPFAGRGERVLRIGLLADRAVLAECELSIDPFPADNPAARAIPGNASLGLLPVRPVFDRVPTDNDRGCAFVTPGHATAHITWNEVVRFGAGAAAHPGTQRTELLSFRWKARSEIARAGVRTILPAEAVVAVAWHGRGPGENYPDRKTAAMLGWHRCNRPQLLATPYTRPQENGERCDVRTLRLWAADGSCIEISADAPFGFCLRPYLSEQLAEATHADELPAPDEPPQLWELTLDAAMRGVGGDNSWGAQPEDAYRLVPGAPGATGLIRFLVTQTAAGASAAPRAEG